MSRIRLAGLIAAALAFPLIVGSSALARADPRTASTDTASTDTEVAVDAEPATLAWMSTSSAEGSGSGIFSVDASARTVRYRGCDGDTGRVDDPGMEITDGVATGRVTVDGTKYRYRVPLEGRTEGVLKVSRPHQQTEVLTGQVVTNPQPPADPDPAQRLDPLTERLQAIIDDSPNPAGVAVRDLSGRYGDAQIEVNGTFRPKAASVIKLWILTELLRKVDCGAASLTDGVLVLPSDVVDGTGELQHETFPQTVTLYRLAEYMIKYSDNTATNVLIKYLGGFAPVNALIDSMNQRETTLARKMLDTEAAKRGEENYLSANDVVSLLGAVWDGQVLSAPSRELMIHFMLEQTINTKIPAALPPGVPVAHKTGELPDASHDVGYYLIPGTEIAVAFVTSGTEVTGAETVRQLARAVYDYLQLPAADEQTSAQLLDCAGAN